MVCKHRTFQIGRLAPEGGWVLTQSTPRAANQAVTLGNPASLKINEWMASPTNGSDWFEVYNPEPLPVCLSGLLYPAIDRRLCSVEQIRLDAKHLGDGAIESQSALVDPFVRS